jgi:cysteinyl-tRNA synthetase
MSIQLYNTLTRRKELFQPIDAADVRVYVCGPTVYDYAHIGNARPVVVFDTLYRSLRRTCYGHHVTYVRNITDVEDKIIAAAAGREAIADLTQRMTAVYHADMGALNALAPDHEPRATAFIGEMVAMIQTLVGSRPCLCRRGPCPLRRPFHARLWRARAPLAGRHDRRRPGRGRASQ